MYTSWCRFVRICENIKNEESVVLNYVSAITAVKDKLSYCKVENRQIIKQAHK